MSLEGDLYDYLAGLTSISDAIGTQLYRGYAPTSATKPYVVFETVSGDRAVHLGGSTGLVESLVQFDVWAGKSVVAGTVAAVLRAALHGYQHGAINGAGSTDVRSISLVADRSRVEPAAEGEQVLEVNQQLDFSVWHRETVTTYPAT